MVHTRINERSTNPNPYINFISALPSNRHSRDDQEATELMRALAAQLKPVMKAHGFTVNSFEEYESNKVFLGRNWNNGETVELVLRDGSNQFYPISTLLSVFCHELAHIKHMNHSIAFHTLRRQLCGEVATLQRKGYYGDGYWSAGTRLSDSRRIQGDAQSVQELPEYTCGGAHARSRSSALPSRRRNRRVRGPSLSTGAQTAKRRKAGSRVTSKTAFEAAGGGSVLDECIQKGGKGSGFGKQAGSQRAREERALAAENRLLQMQGKLPPQPSPVQHEERSIGSESDNEDDGFDERYVPETDGERLKMMQDLMGGEDLGALRDTDDDDVVFVSDTSRTFTNPSEIKGTRSGKGNAIEQQTAGPSRKSSAHEDGYEAGGPSSAKRRRLTDGTHSGKEGFGSTASSGIGLGVIVDAEMRQRKRESLGMDRGRRLGGNTGGAVAGNTGSHKTSAGARTTPGMVNPAVSAGATHEWSCRRCTFANATDQKNCVMCDGTRAWTCSLCTFENSGGEKCEICDGPCA